MFIKIQMRIVSIKNPVITITIIHVNEYLLLSIIVADLTLKHAQEFPYLHLPILIL